MGETGLLEPEKLSRSGVVRGHTSVDDNDFRLVHGFVTTRGSIGGVDNQVDIAEVVVDIWSVQSYEFLDCSDASRFLWRGFSEIISAFDLTIGNGSRVLTSARLYDQPLSVHEFH